MALQGNITSLGQHAQSNTAHRGIRQIIQRLVILTAQPAPTTVNSHPCCVTYPVIRARRCSRDSELARHRSRKQVYHATCARAARENFAFLRVQTTNSYSHVRLPAK